MSVSNLPLVLGRVLIAAAWADGELSQDERRALEDLLFSMPGLDGDTWRALAADIDRPFPPEHLQTLLEQLRSELDGDRAREHARETLEEMARRLGPDTPEAAALREALEVVTDRPEVAPSDDGGWWGRLRGALGGSLGEHAGRVRRFVDREQEVERALEGRVAEALAGDPAAADPERVHRLALAASILAHVVRLDDVVEAGERDALRAALVEQYGLDEQAASVVTELALDEVATGVDLHVLLREFARATDEDERQRFLAAVFRVAAGDGRASYDEIEEVRRIGRGLLLSHRHFIAAKLTLPGRDRDT